MTATALLQPGKHSHSFESLDVMTEYDEMRLTVNSLTSDQAKTLCKVARSFNQTYGTKPAAADQIPQASISKSLVLEAQANQVKAKAPQLPEQLKFQIKFAAEARKESSLSSQFGKNVTQLDLLILFVKIMALLIDAREQQKSCRKLEREGHILNMKGVEELLKDQGNAQLISGIVAGLTSFLAGAAPIFGYSSLGNSFKDKLSSWFSLDKAMDKDLFYRGVSRMLQSISQSGDNANKIHGSFSQGKQVKSQTKGDINKLDWEEWTRNIESTKEYWRNLENFISQLLNLDHEAVKAIYSQT